MIYLVAIIGLLVFIYFNRYIQRKRDERREHWRERREEQLQQFFEAKKKHPGERNDEAPTEVGMPNNQSASDTTEV